jgi:hypothetical protein
VHISPRFSPVLPYDVGDWRTESAPHPNPDIPSGDLYIP